MYLYIYIYMYINIYKDFIYKIYICIYIKYKNTYRKKAKTTN